MRSRSAFMALTLAFGLFGWLGCGNDKPQEVITGGPPDIVHETGHDHAAEGPHHGDLIELGNEEYHAELVHDDATHVVTIYVLDGAAKANVPIDAKELSVNLVVDGVPVQYALAAKPEATDPAGKSSAFSITSEKLVHALHGKGTKGRVSIDIAGKSFVGQIAGDDHAGHSHSHDGGKK